MKFVTAIGVMIISAYLAIQATYKSNIRSTEFVAKKNKSRYGNEGKNKSRYGNEGKNKSRYGEEGKNKTRYGEIETNKSRYIMEN